MLSTANDEQNFVPRSPAHTDFGQSFHSTLLTFSAAFWLYPVRHRSSSLRSFNLSNTGLKAKATAFGKGLCAYKIKGLYCICTSCLHQKTACGEELHLSKFFFATIITILKKGMSEFSFREKLLAMMRNRNILNVSNWTSTNLAITDYFNLLLSAISSLFHVMGTHWK